VLALIEATRSRVVTAVNTALIDLYWRIGQYISRMIAEEGWGQGTVAALAEYIRARRPNARGFSASNLWRMMQFYETYRGLPKLAPLVASFVVDPQPPDHEPQQAGCGVSLCELRNWQKSGTLGHTHSATPTARGLTPWALRWPYSKR
jgi:DUF1016 N-terminal domain